MIKPCCCKVRRALQVFVIVSSLVFSTHAQAILLQIDSSISQITYTPAADFGFCVGDLWGVITCPEPPVAQTAALSGVIELNITHEHWEFGTYITDRDLLLLTSRSFSAGPLSAKFPRVGTTAIIVGEQFEVRDDPCFLSPFPGLCSSTGWSYVHWGEDGTWDGHSLTWTGYSWVQNGDGHAFTIHAEVLPVSEPGALALMILGLISFITTKPWQARPRA